MSAFARGDFDKVKPRLAKNFSQSYYLPAVAIIRMIDLRNCFRSYYEAWQALPIFCWPGQNSMKSFTSQIYVQRSKGMTLKAWFMNNTLSPINIVRFRNYWDFLGGSCISTRKTSNHAYAFQGGEL